MSNADQVQLARVNESIFGSTVTGSNLKVMRITSETLAMEPSFVQSNELTPDRMVADVARVSIHAAGETNFELSAGSFDDEFLVCLHATAYSTAVTVTGTTISAAAADNSFNDSGSGFGSLAVGQWVLVTGFVTAANNGFYKIVTKTSAKIVVAGNILVNEAAGASVTVNMGAQVVNGTTFTSMNIEKKFGDLTNIFSLLRGMSPSVLNLNVVAQQIVTGSMAWMGKDEVSLAASAGTGYTANTTNNVMTATDGVMAVIEGLMTVAGSARFNTRQFTMSMNNNLRERSEVAVLGPPSLGSGQIAITGTLQAYFANSALIDKMINVTESALAVGFKDTNNKGYLIEIPRLKFTAGKRVAGGINTDVIADMTWTAKKHPTENVMIRIASFA